MTVRLHHAVYGVVAVAAAVLLVRQLGGEEAAIGRRLDALGDVLERERGESALAAAAKARTLADFFVDPPQVRLLPFGQTIADRAELMRGYVAYRGGYAEITAGLRDVETTVASSGIDAETVAVVVLTGSGGGAPARDAFRATFAWRKVGGTWKLREVVVLEVLEGLEAYF